MPLAKQIAPWSLICIINTAKKTNLVNDYK